MGVCKLRWSGGYRCFKNTAQLESIRNAAYQCLADAIPHTSQVSSSGGEDSQGFASTVVCCDKKYICIHNNKFGRVNKDVCVCACRSYLKLVFFPLFLHLFYGNMLVKHVSTLY